MQKKLLFPLMAAAVVGCGDPIAAGTYRGEPLVRLHGTLVGDAGTSSIRHPYLAIVWFNISDLSMGEPEAVTILAPISAGPLSREFTVDLWDPPPRKAIGTSYGSEMALGVAVAIDDVDGNGRVEIDPLTNTIAPPDLAFGGAFSQWLIFVGSTGRAECQEIAFGKQGVVPGVYLTSTDECSAPFPLLSKDTPLEISMFPPASDLSTVPGAEGDPEGPDCSAECGQPGEPYWCKEEIIIVPCIEGICVRDEERFAKCVERHCSGDWSSSCITSLCEKEAAAYENCIVKSCSMNTFCKP
ncbi:hypothetical protein [Vulgatibacter incomptus]|uniref:Lipoprotein n=1 Tax=Vulgatibacter incomptus TaxID=1391653 RepID=A0A0K1PDF6_9BACT|nr:hypothetical protein [Vulgatibacter incomptus]AKU91149.1 hypothetical protein AKJ08_1536 [Vulgatibacter incomptus]